jgi:hypothetical protein
MVIVKSYNNKSRKGLYYFESYKTQEGKTRTITINSNSMTLNEFENYSKEVKLLKTAEDKRSFNKNFRLAKAEKEKEIEEKEKVKRKDYSLEKDLSETKLMDNKDRHKHKGSFRTESDYRNDESVIIAKLGNKGSLSEMNEEQFKNKLYSYFKINKPMDRNQELFLNDVINKWGKEFK